MVESYDRLMAFIAKHLPDKFFLEKAQRISLRDHMFREVAANMLIHRELLNPYPAKLVIETHRLSTENSNKPHGQGLINPASFTPFLKNPVIARFFEEIGLADELGSGVRNLFKYCRHYSEGKSPELVEGDIFTCIVPLTPEATLEATMQVTEQVAGQVERVKQIREFCQIPRSGKEIQTHIKIKDAKFILRPLLEGKVLKPTIPDKPTSPNQKYYSPEGKK